MTLRRGRSGVAVSGSACRSPPKLVGDRAAALARCGRSCLQCAAHDDGNRVYAHDSTRTRGRWPTGPAGRRCRRCTCRLRLCRWGSTRQRGVAPADPRRAAGGGGLRAHTSGRAATRAIGHGDPSRATLQEAPSPAAGRGSAKCGRRSLGCELPPPRRARSSQGVLQVWVGGVCSGAPRVAPSRRVRCTRSAIRGAPTRLLVRDRLSDVGAVPERCSVAPPVVSVSASTWFLRCPPPRRAIA